MDATPNDGLGSMGWARRTRGRLTRAQELGQLWSAVLTQVRASWLRAFSGVLRAEPPPLPDTPLVQKAQALCLEACPGFLAQHCLRTYAWGALLGGKDGVAYDAEVLCVAALLHDLGHTASFRTTEEMPCFAAAGAQGALAFLERCNASPSQRERVAEAICLHMNTRVPRALGEEAHLLHAGAGLDVMGLRAGELAPELLRAVVERHPRLGFKERFAEVMDAEARRRPRTRVAFMAGALQLSRRIQRAPFEE